MRIVSLVPSLTETVAAMQGDAGPVTIVGRTPWCIHPAAVVHSVPVVGGTKTPNVRKIIRLKPDLVLLDRQENRLETFDALQAAKIPTFVCDVTAVADVPPMLRTLGEAMGQRTRADILAADLEAALARLPRASPAGPIVVPLIWHEPLMALAASRYGGDLLARVGFRVADFGPNETGYPTVTAEQIGAAKVEFLLLSSEPHDFTPTEGKAIADAVAVAGFAPPTPVKIDGEALTWFGVRTRRAIDYWHGLRADLRPRPARPES